MLSPNIRAAIKGINEFSHLENLVLQVGNPLADTIVSFVRENTHFNEMLAELYQANDRNKDMIDTLISEVVEWILETVNRQLPSFEDVTRSLDEACIDDFYSELMDDYGSFIRDNDSLSEQQLYRQAFVAVMTKVFDFQQKPTHVTLHRKAGKIRVIGSLDSPLDTSLFQQHFIDKMTDKTIEILMGSSSDDQTIEIFRDKDKRLNITKTERW